MCAKWMILTMVVALLLLEGSAFAASDPAFDASVPSFSWPKSSFGTIRYAEEIDPPNILFLIDTSGSMTLDPKDRDTWGDGSHSWYVNRTYGYQNYAGRDTDPSNNDPNDPANYHPLLPNMPNDSRLYILRNVMYRLLTEKSDILEGMNIALGTYNQNFAAENGTAGYYQYYYRVSPWRYNYTDMQITSWNGSAPKGMRLRLGLAPAVDSETKLVRQDFLQIFDGSESNGMPSSYQQYITDPSWNQELRASGNTPLAASIYPDGGQPVTSAYNFFASRSGTYDGVCQANWLIVMTDGEDTASNRTPREAVRLLYQQTGGAPGRSLKDKENKNLFYPVRTMVIGFINSADMPTLATELDLCADVGFDGVFDGEPAHAYYADNFEGLFSAFEDILVTIKEMSGRKSPPRVRAGLPGVEGASYIPQMVYFERKLWHGKLEKYRIGYDGTFGAKLWESSFPPEGSRKVYTANWHSSRGFPVAGTNLIEFKDVAGNDSGWQSVVEELGIRYALSGNSLLPADDPRIEPQTRCFIRWYRGEIPDATLCPHWRKRESPMADMDRSGISIVGAPRGPWLDSKYLAFKKDHKDRVERLYIQSSEGMLHSFNTESGFEEWAFIPPLALRWSRLAGLRAERNVVFEFGANKSFWDWDWYGIDADKKGEDLPREILGGSLVAEDVLLGSGSSAKYATVLLGTMGYGGYGIYAMDVTNPQTPKFLWAVENAAVGFGDAHPNHFLPYTVEPGTKYYPVRSVLHWEGKATSSPSATFRVCTYREGSFRTDNKKYRGIEQDRLVACTDSFLTSRHMQDYQYMGFLLGEPFVGRVHFRAENSTEDLLPLGFMGGGLRNHSTDPLSDALGCVIYAFGLEDGRLHAVWGKGVTDAYSPTDLFYSKEVPEMGMIYAPISVLFSPLRTVERFFAPDSEGYIHHIILEEEKSLGQGDWKHQISARLLLGTSPLIIPYQMPVGKIGGALWLFAGTKDVPTPLGELKNDRNFIVGIKISAYCEDLPCDLDCSRDPLLMEDLMELDAAVSADRIYIDNTPCGYEKDGSDTFWGWQIPLRLPGTLYNGKDTRGEYVSAAPALSNLFERLIVGTFEPYMEELGGENVDNPCSDPIENGMGRLYLLHGVSGLSDWPEDVPAKYVELEGVMPTGIAAYDTFYEDEDGNVIPGTRIVITFLATDEARKDLSPDGANELQKILADAGVVDISTDGEGVMSGFIPLPEGDPRSSNLRKFDSTEIIFWKQPFAQPTVQP